jgi:hypothetical protein
MAAKTAKKARKSSLSAAGQAMGSEEGDLRAERIQDTLPHLSNKDAKRVKADNSLPGLFGGRGWGHNIANGNQLRITIKGILAAGPAYEIPNGGALGGSILKRQYKADIADDSRVLRLTGVSKYGATPTTYGATIQSHPLLNVVLFCVSFSAIMLSKSASRQRVAAAEDK